MATLLKTAFTRIMGLTPKRSVGAAATALDPRYDAQAVCPHLAAQRGLDAMPRPAGMCPGVGSGFQTFARYKPTNGHRMIMDRIRSLGKIYYDKIFSFECVNVADPVDAATVFRNEGKFPVRPEVEAWKHPRDEIGMPLGIVLSEGELWYSYRRAMDRQLMLYSNLHKYVPALNDIASDYIQVLVRNQETNPEGYVKDLKHEQFRWSLESTSQLLYDKRLGNVRLDAPPDPEILDFANAVDEMFRTSQILVVLSTTQARFLAPMTLWKHNKAWKTIFRVGRKHVAAKLAEIKKAEEEGRLEELAARGGFMLSLVDEQRRAARRSDIKLNIDQVTCNAVEIMAAGVDTVGTSQQWLMHLLAINPDKQERLRRELAPVKNGPITPEFLTSPQSSYLKACVKESMRLRPVLVGTARVLDRDVVVGGYNVPKGTYINILDFIMSTDEKNFPQADKYIPERWLKREHDEKIQKASSNNFSSLPFGFGPRMCIGRRFAETEMFILTSRMVRDYKIVDMNGGHLIEPSTNLLMMPKEPLKLRFEKLP